MNTSEFPIQLIPEVPVARAVPGPQGLIIKPSVIPIRKTQGGIILESGIETDAVKNGLLQQGTVVRIGKLVEEQSIGDTVFFYTSGCEAMIRDKNEEEGKDEIYYVFSNYNIKLTIKN